METTLSKINWNVPENLETFFWIFKKQIRFFLFLVFPRYEFRFLCSVIWYLHSWYCLRLSLKGFFKSPDGPDRIWSHDRANDLENNRSFSTNIITDVATTNKLHFGEARRKFYLRSTLYQCVKIAFIFLREFLRRHLLWFILVIGFFGDNDFGDIAMLVTDGRCSWQNDYVCDFFFIVGVLNVLNQSITSCHQNFNLWK